jgi:hypothetical protein
MFLMFSDSFFFAVYLTCQITRDRVRCKGRLVSKRTTDSSSTNPRWLVAFDENSWEEQDMYESSFGMVISKSSGKGHASARRNGNNGKSKKAAAPGVTASTGIDSAHMDANNSKVSNKKTTELMQVDTPTVPTVSPCSSLGEGSSASKKRKADDSEDPSDGSTKATGKLSSDREVRRKRRQALVEEEEVKIAVAKAESPPAQKLKMDEDVIRVPMLTGTLFLYRGSHRRAEFIYKK